MDEFRNLIAQNLGVGATASIYAGNGLDPGQYTSNGYSSSPSGAYNDLNGNAGYGGIPEFGTAPVPDGTGQISGNDAYTSYDQAPYSSSPANGGDEFNINTTSPGIKMTGTTGVSRSSSSFETGGTQRQAQDYATSAQGLYQDPNPQIIRRPAQGGHVTYTQNIKIRFLQPPAIPPPGVSSSLRYLICTSD